MSEQRLYRGITKDGKWVKGFVIETDREIFITSGDPAYRDWIGGTVCKATFYCKKVIPETVGQSIGIKLEGGNGKEVFGGDLIDLAGMVYEVIWNGVAAQWWMQYLNNEQEPTLLWPLCEALKRDYAKVIGTIHDHLLKGES